MNHARTSEDLLEEWRAEMRHEQELSESLVHDIAERLVQAGHQPTAAAVRKVHGGGSPNLIHPALRKFFAGELQDRWVMPNDPDLPKPLMDLWGACLKAARETAAEALEATRKDLDERQAKLARKEKDLAHQAEVMAARGEEASRREQQVRARLAQAIRSERNQQRRYQALAAKEMRERERADTAAAELREVNEQARRQAKEIQALSENLKIAISASKDAEQEAKARDGQTRAELAAIAKDKAVLEARIADFEERERELNMQIATAKEEAASKVQQAEDATRGLAEENKRLASEVSESRAQRDAAIKERDAAVRETGKTERLLVEEKERFAKLQATLDSLTRSLGKQKAAHDEKKGG